MEREIFIQTLKSFEMQIEEGGQLPSEMNNMQFTSVLKLWKERVVDAAKPRSRKVLEKQHELILSFKEPRDALTHGMWDWKREDQSRVSTVRVKKKTLKTADFNTGFLQDMSTQLGEINFNIRFPRGTSELVISQMKQGGYMSRSAWAMMSGDGLPDDRLDVTPYQSFDDLGVPVFAKDVTPVPGFGEALDGLRLLSFELLLLLLSGDIRWPAAGACDPFAPAPGLL